MENIIVYGAGGHGKSVIDLIEDQGQYRIANVLDDNEEGADHLLGYPIIRNGEEITEIIRNAYGGVVAIADSHTRSRIVSRIEALSPIFRFVNIIHPAACISRHARIGQGAVIMYGVRIGTETIIGNHCIICSKTLIPHDSIVGDYAFFGGGVICSGNVTVGEHCYVLSGSVIINNITIGHHTVIGSGSNVVGDIPPNVVVFGNPAKAVRTREPDNQTLFRKRDP